LISAKSEAIQNHHQKHPTLPPPPPQQALTVHSFPSDPSPASCAAPPSPCSSPHRRCHATPQLLTAPSLLL
jgi:hypothetical protein